MSITINPNNIEIESDEICLICREDLNKEQIYEIPECKHKYHTNCLINWFRFNRCSCPYCNKDLYFDQSSNSYNYEKYINNYKYISNYSRRKDAPKVLKNKIQKIREKQKNLKNISKEITEIKNKKGNYNEIHKKIVNLRNKKWRLKSSIWRMKKKLCNDVTVIPIIVRRRIEIEY